MGTWSAGRQRAGAHQEEAAPALGEGIVLQGGGPEVGVDHVAGLLAQVGHPGGKLDGVGQRSRQEHHLGLLRQEDDGLLPDHAALPVLHVVHLVKDDPGHLPLQLGAPVAASQAGVGQCAHTNGGPMIRCAALALCLPGEG